LLEKNGIATKFSPDLTLSEIDSLESINYISEVIGNEIIEGPKSKSTHKSESEKYSLLKLKNKSNFQPIIQKEWFSENGKKQISFDTLSSKFHKIEIVNLRNHFSTKEKLNNPVKTKKQKSIAIVSDINGKKGIINSLGEQVIPIVYDSISNTILLEDCKKAHIICFKNKKCGVINLQNKIVIPFEFDKLFMDLKMEKQSDKLFQLCYKLNNGIIARKASKFGIVNDQGEVLGFKFDKIKYVISTRSFQLLKDDKYGILQNERSLYPKKGNIPSVLVEPIFSYPIDGITKISGYLLGIVLDHRSRIKGYVDTKGFNYFKN